MGVAWRATPERRSVQGTDTTTDITPVTDSNVRRRPVGYWRVHAECVVRLGTGRVYPMLPRTLLDVIGVVGEWHA